MITKVVYLPGHGSSRNNGVLVGKRLTTEGECSSQVHGDTFIHEDFHQTIGRANIEFCKEAPILITGFRTCPSTQLLLVASTRLMKSPAQRDRSSRRCHNMTVCATVHLPASIYRSTFGGGF